ncbi:efflux RND transporter permease subunit [Dryocola clanedunensis]
MWIINFIDRSMTVFLTWVFQHRLKSALLLILVAGSFIGYGVPQLHTDGRIEAFMYQDDPSLLKYHELRKQFGQDNRIVVTVTGDDVFTTPFITKLSALHIALQNQVPYISEIFSLHNIPFIEYEKGGVYLEELMRNVLHEGKDPHILKERVLSTPLYQNFVIDRSGKTAAIIIEPFRYAPNKQDCVADPANGKTCPFATQKNIKREFLSSAEYDEMTLKVAEITRDFSGPGFVIHTAGAPIVSSEIVRIISQDMPRFTLACILIALISIGVIFRSVIIAAGALLAFICSILTMLALMGLCGVAMTPPTQFLIPMGLTMMLCVYVHFMLASTNACKPGVPRMSLFSHAMKHTHHPILFSILTSADGLLGFLSSDLAPIAALGIFGMVVTLTSYFFALFWGTQAIAALPERYTSHERTLTARTSRGVIAIGSVGINHPRKTVLVFALALGGAICLLPSLRFSHNSLKWLEPHNVVRQATEFIDSRFNGTVNLELIVTPAKGYDFRSEPVLRAAQRAVERVYKEVDIPIGRHTSLISFMDETNMAIHDGDPAQRVIPRQQQIWEQFFLLEGEGNSTIMRYVSIDYSLGRITFLVPWLEAMRYSGVSEQVAMIFTEELGQLGSVNVTGLINLLANTSKAVLDNMVSSYLVTLSIIAVLMCYCLRSFQLGLISMIANVLPYVMVLGIMALFDIPMDTFTILIGGILTGLIVDETLHMFYTFRYYLSLYPQPQDALRATLKEVGNALLMTSVVVTLSFSVFLLSSMSNIRSFGSLMMAGVIVALLSDIIMMPALMMLLPQRLYQGIVGGRNEQQLA